MYTYEYMPTVQNKDRFIIVLLLLLLFSKNAHAYSGKFKMSTGIQRHIIKDIPERPFPKIRLKV